jgi:hypothetical protein
VFNDLSWLLTMIESYSFYLSVRLSIIEAVPLFSHTIISKQCSQIITYYDCNQVITVCKDGSRRVGGLPLCCRHSAWRGPVPWRRLPFVRFGAERTVSGQCTLAHGVRGTLSLFSLTHSSPLLLSSSPACLLPSVARLWSCLYLLLKAHLPL